MAEDLLPYLERQFSAINQQFATVNHQFATVNQRLDSIDQRLESVDQRLDSVDQRLEAVETNVRGAYVLIEDLQDQVRLVAEGVTSCNEQLKQQREDVTRRIDAVESFNRLSYQDLDSRVRRLEKTA